MNNNRGGDEDTSIIVEKHGHKKAEQINIPVKLDA